MLKNGSVYDYSYTDICGLSVDYFVHTDTHFINKHAANNVNFVIVDVLGVSQWVDEWVSFR